MRLVKAMLVSAMLLAFLAPPAAAQRGPCLPTPPEAEGGVGAIAEVEEDNPCRPCNPLLMPFWGDVLCEADWGEHGRHRCVVHWEYYGCKACGQTPVGTVAVVTVWIPSFLNMCGPLAS